MAKKNDFEMEPFEVDVTAELRAVGKVHRERAKLAWQFSHASASIGQTDTAEMWAGFAEEDEYTANLMGFILGEAFTPESPAELQ